MLNQSRFLRRRDAACSAYAKSWRSKRREPVVKKSAASLLRGLSVLIFDEGASGNIRRE